MYTNVYMYVCVCVCMSMCLYVYVSVCVCVTVPLAVKGPGNESLPLDFPRKPAVECGVA